MPASAALPCSSAVGLLLLISGEPIQTPLAHGPVGDEAAGSIGRSRGDTPLLIRLDSALGECTKHPDLVSTNDPSSAEDESEFAGR